MSDYFQQQVRLTVVIGSVTLQIYTQSNEGTLGFLYDVYSGDDLVYSTTDDILGLLSKLEELIDEEIAKDPDLEVNSNGNDDEMVKSIKLFVEAVKLSAKNLQSFFESVELAKDIALNAIGSFTR
jgi:hypothetical protein